MTYGGEVNVDLAGEDIVEARCAMGGNFPRGDI